MKFSKLVIKNFRSISPEGIEITFGPEQNVAVLVGGNATGKTNILTALGIVLGSYPFNRFLPESTDFYAGKCENEILVELHLWPPLLDHDVYRNEYEIAGFRYRAARYERGDQKGSSHVEHYCFDDKGNTLVKPVRIFRAKGKPDNGVDNAPRPVLVNAEAWKLGSVFFLDPHTLEHFFDRTTGWGPFARLLERYREDFEADHNQYVPDGDPAKALPSREAYDRFCRRLTEILRTDKLQEIESGLSSHVKQYLGYAASEEPLKVELGMPTHQELFAKHIGLQVTERTDLPSFPIDRIGAGYRALLRLAVLQTLLDMKSDGQQSILLIEEPEVYLHVHLKRYFSNVLRRLAEEGNQLVLTTHSPEFVDLARPHEIIRLHRSLDPYTVPRQVSLTTQLDFTHLKQKVYRMGNEEVVFANHAILTEGQDDQGIIHELLTRAGVDIDVYSISVVNCDSVTQLKDYIHLCHELGIDFYAIHDRDNDSEPLTARRNQAIAQAAADTGQLLPSLHVYDPDLEAMVGAEKQRGNLEELLSILGDKTYGQIGREYPDLVRPVDEFISTRGLRSATTPQTEHYNRGTNQGSENTR